MKDLMVRLNALDPNIETAVRVIDYFDDLLTTKAGLEAVVRAATVLSECPAALVDDTRRIRIRVDENGERGIPVEHPDPAWPSRPVGPNGGMFWLERSGPPVADGGVDVDAIVLERAVIAASVVLNRTRGCGCGQVDRAALDVLLDGSVGPHERRTAARRLGLPASERVRAVAVHGGGARIQRADEQPAVRGRPADGLRAGIGPAGTIDDLPSSWDAARLALRLTAEGTADDPGPRVVHAEEAGSLTELAAIIGQEKAFGDVTVLERTARTAPWMLATLDAVATAPSRRAAARMLHLHPTTLRERLAHAERGLGWSLCDPSGRFRLHLALVLRRLQRGVP
jgi:hypothetical protein